MSHVLHLEVANSADPSHATGATVSMVQIQPKEFEYSIEFDDDNGTGMDGDAGGFKVWRIFLRMPSLPMCSGLKAGSYSSGRGYNPALHAWYLALGSVVFPGLMPDIDPEPSAPSVRSTGGRDTFEWRAGGADSAGYRGHRRLGVGRSLRHAHL